MTQQAVRPGRAAQDALELELFREAIKSVIDELEINLTRTAYSPLIYEYKDFSVGILTRDFRVANQSERNIPIFIADLGPPVKDIVDLIGEEDMDPGDVFVTNFNPVIGQHLNNAVAATPIFGEDGIIGYLAIKSHWADVGGGVLGGQHTLTPRHIIQEGTQYRGLRLVRRGKIAPEVLATIQANTYQPKVLTGDLMAQLAACMLGAKRWDERVASRWSEQEIDELFETQFAASADYARRRVAELPDGEYRAECRLDDSGEPGSEPLDMKVRLVVDGERMVVDLSEMPPQSELPINTGAFGGAVAATRVAFKSIIAPDWPPDEALFDPLDVEIPDGTLLSAVHDAPMGLWNTTMSTVIDLVVRAIGESFPERVPAGHFGTMAILQISGTRPDGSWWICQPNSSGGFGGNAESDGYGPLKCLMLGDNMSIPCEVIEARHPLRFHEFKLAREVGGAGRHRGGPGVRRTIEVLEPVRVSTLMERTLDPAWGLAGGEPGRPGQTSIKPAGSDDFMVANKVNWDSFEAGTVIRDVTGGGGGWGAPDGEGGADGR